MKNLIKFDDNPELDLVVFKEMVNELPWYKKIRKLGSVEQTFFIATLETDEKIIHISIRPSKRMQISESFKNRDTEGRAIPEGRQVREVVNFGATVEILVDDSLINKINSIAKDYVKPKQQVISWS